MQIQVLGPGCQKCQVLLKNAREAVAQADVTADVVKIEDMFEIAARGVNRTPAIIIDGQLKLQGRVATAQEISEWLSSR